MSTRSIILVTGNDHYNSPKTVRLYKHCDGYPTGNLSLILEALDTTIKDLKDYNKRWAKLSEPKPMNVSHLVGKIIGASTDVHGIGANIDTYEDDAADYDETFNLKHLGNQSDLEWIYVVDVTKSTVKIYGGGYTGGSPQIAYKKGVVNLLNYIKSLKSEYQAAESKETLELVAAIEKLGFKVNPKKTKKVKA